MEWSLRPFYPPCSCFYAYYLVSFSNSHPIYDYSTGCLSQQLFLGTDGFPMTSDNSEYIYLIFIYRGPSFLSRYRQNTFQSFFDNFVHFLDFLRCSLPCYLRTTPKLTVLLNEIPISLLMSKTVSCILVNLYHPFVSC